MRAVRASAFGVGLAAVMLAGVCAPVLARSPDVPVADAKPAASAPSKGVVGVRLGGDQHQARIVLDLDRTTAGKIVADGAERITVNLAKIGAAEGLHGTSPGLVRAWSVRREGDGARLILDLAGKGEIKHRFLMPPSAGTTHYRYVIDIAEAPGVVAVPSKGVAAAPAVVAPVQTAKADTPAPPVSVSRPDIDKALASVLPPPAPAAPSPLVPVVQVGDADTQIEPRSGRGGFHNAKSSRRAIKVVVIDAGHGGHDPGAQSAAYNEKDITLATALALRARLERSGHYKVVMTRSSDVFISLERRVQIAREAKADLFIALHADSAGTNADAHGASIYTLSDNGGKRVHTVLTGNEWFNKSAGRADDPAVGQILLDLTQRNTRNQSAVFAGLLIDRISDRVDLLPNSHRDAGYFVLLAPDVPAVLLEMGFITSPIDQPRLTSPAQQGRLADGIAAAIDTYFKGPAQLASR